MKRQREREIRRKRAGERERRNRENKWKRNTEIVYWSKGTSSKLIVNPRQVSYAVRQYLRALLRKRKIDISINPSSPKRGESWFTMQGSNNNVNYKHIYGVN